MANNSSLLDAFGIPFVSADKDIGGVKYPQSMLVDKDGNELVWTTQKNLAGGFTMSLQDPTATTPTDLETAVVNGAFLVRGGNQQEAFFSNFRMLSVAATQYAWDAGRVNPQGSASFRKVTLASGIAEPTNGAADQSSSYQGSVIPCRIFRYFGTFSARTYLKIWDRNSPPTIGTDAPKWVLPVPSGDIDRSLEGITLQNGFYYAFHTTRQGVTVPTTGVVTDFGIIKG